MRKLILVLALFIVTKGQAQQKVTAAPGFTDLGQLLTAMPGLPSSASEAFGIAYRNDLTTVASLEIDERVKRFERLIDSARKRLKYSADTVAARLRLQGDLEDGVYSREELIDQNPLVGQSGGFTKLSTAGEEERKQMLKDGAARSVNYTGNQYNHFSILTDEEVAKMISDPAYAAKMEAKLKRMSPKEMEQFVKSRTPAMKKHHDGAELDHMAFESLMKNRYTHGRVQYFKQDLSYTLIQASKTLEAFNAAVKDLREQKGNHEVLKKQEAEELAVLSNYDARLTREVRLKYLEQHVWRADEELAAIERYRKNMLSAFLRLAEIYDRAAYYFHEESGHMLEREKLSLLYRFLETEMALVDMSASLLKVYREETFNAAVWYHDHLAQQ